MRGVNAGDASGDADDAKLGGMHRTIMEKLSLEILSISTIIIWISDLLLVIFYFWLVMKLPRWSDGDFLKVFRWRGKSSEELQKLLRYLKKTWKDIDWIRAIMSKVFIFLIGGMIALIPIIIFSGVFSKEEATFMTFLLGLCPLIFFGALLMFFLLSRINWLSIKRLQQICDSQQSQNFKQDSGK